MASRYSFMDASKIYNWSSKSFWLLIRTFRLYLIFEMPCGVLARLVVYLILAVVSLQLGVPVLSVCFLDSSAIVQTLDRHGLNHAVKRSLFAVSLVEAVGYSAVSHRH